MSVTPKVSGLNHITLAVSDLDRSIGFYRNVLGLRLRAQWTEGAYLEVGSLWLCLSVDKATRVSPHPDYSHIAFDIDDEIFDQMAKNIEGTASIWQENRSEGKSLYFLDPDGHKLELHVGSLASRLQHYRVHPIPDRIIFD